MTLRTRRSIDGVLLLDKPVGLTSNGALQAVKHLYQARKAGHTGSLDPLASGLLPICLGEATKISGFLLNADKTYQFTCRLGVTTTTGDAEGEVLTTHPVSALSRDRIEAVLHQFIGGIQQVPPMYSAVKRAGQPLYKLARRGIEVEREPREVVIHELRLLRHQADELECMLRCSKGTYVRALAVDIGNVLGCGAHVAALRRTAIGPYDAASMVTLDVLREGVERAGPTALDQWLLPLDSAVIHWPAISVVGDSAFYLRQGQAVLVPRAPTQGWVRLYEGEQRFLGIGEILGDGRVAPRRLVGRGSV